MRDLALEPASHFGLLGLKSDDWCDLLQDTVFHGAGEGGVNEVE